ncbi:MAG: sodium:proton antiporter [Pirellulales bacterium]
MPNNPSKMLYAAIGVMVLLYCVAFKLGWFSLDGHAAGHAVAAEAAAAHGEHAHEHAHAEPPTLWMVIPFALLLGCIAVFPLIHKLEHHWESNRNKFLVATGLGLIVLTYYLLGHHHPIDKHFMGHGTVAPAASGPSWQLVTTVLANAILQEYVPFIVLLFALYTISGGIRVEGDLPAHPLTNCTFLGIGALMASFVGTTGAAMLLIRPLLETNKERKHIKHTVIFFIFIVCNCGGLLLPLGDPPLFLGYLAGVPFFWTLKLWAPWLLTNLLLLGIYFAWDHFFAYPKETKPDILRDETQVRPLRIRGLMPNALLLFGVVAAVATLDPNKTFPGTETQIPYFMREVVLLSLVGLSLFLGSNKVREDNRFNYGAILEVAALFFGIFICMQPPLQILNVRGAELGIDSPSKFFWASGILSSMLDNAPTYVVFFETAKAIGGDPATVPMVDLSGSHIPAGFLVAISLGAVFMGANTYIGNGPNFMVKAIAEKSGVKMPSFFGYMAYSVGILVPIFVLLTLLFFIPGAPLAFLIG